MNLRPLAFGEILDRGVTLAVRNFVRLATIVAVFAIPYVIVFAIVASHTPPHESLASLLAGVNAKGHPPDAQRIFQALGGRPSLSGPSGVFVVIALVAFQLPSGALMHACSSVILRRKVTLAECYGVALRRLPSMLVISFCYVVAGFIVCVVTFFVLLLIFLALGALATVLHTIGVVIGVVVGIVGSLAVLAIASLGFLAYEVSFFTCIVEGGNPFAAALRGLRRVFMRTLFRRSIAVAAAILSISFGLQFVAIMCQGLVAVLVRSDVAGQVVASMVASSISVVMTTILAVFYYDVRIRGEGFDLAIAAETLHEPVLQSGMP